MYLIISVFNVKTIVPMHINDSLTSVLRALVSILLLFILKLNREHL